ncbi:exosortase F system-associated membrane protein [Apibacter adventoris]|uniref:Exosortase F system-associated protein n=1 Tax=Apibacter adventoris TaxID=1679466 RepID=A0A2S8A780_9FLAO|nr:exosortase F system-associated protein [Apibacter adventoris]
MRQIIKIVGIVICFLLLIFIRKYETVLFYDPLLSFFKQSDFNHYNSPPFDSIKLLYSLIFRYFLNSIISIMIIYLWFKNKKITKFSCFIFIIVFILFTILYLISISNNFLLGYMPTYYIRRILIHPLLLLLLIPIFIYTLKFSKN